MTALRASGQRPRPLERVTTVLFQIAEIVEDVDRARQQTEE
jgi:hypothetical protein